MTLVLFYISLPCHDILLKDLVLILFFFRKLASTVTLFLYGLIAIIFIMIATTLAALTLFASSAVVADYTRSPVSNVPGKVFNRFVTIWLENTDYDKAVGDRMYNSFLRRID